MKTIIKEQSSEQTQKVSSFHGEGAYHGAAQFREVPVPEFEEEEVRPTTLIGGKDVFQEFSAKFIDSWRLIRQLSEPSQEQIKNDGVTFAWVPFDVALKESGPLTEKVLLEMAPFLNKKKKLTYIDSKIQFFKQGDIPVDSNLWHVDGSISVRDSRATQHGFPLLHDMKARQGCSVPPPQFMSYQSSTHCATQWIQHSMKIPMPACIPSFDVFDELVKQQKPGYVSQPAASIIKFDGFSIHRAVAAKSDGWRLWVRCTETDREIHLPESAIANYGTVYRPST